MKPNKTDVTAKPQRSYLLRGSVFLVVVAITLAIAINRDRLQEFEELGYLGAFLIMLLSNATLILPAPGLIFIFAMGSTFNPIGIGLSAGLGATLGELTGYMTGYSGLAILENTRIAHRVSFWMNTNGTLTIFILSIIPNPLFDLAGVLAGTGRMPVWKFLGVAFCGKFIQAALIAVAGGMSLTWVEDMLTR
jgi:uncharacterized membrane protein YdjX (TVP38/TMEM64 family)